MYSLETISDMGRIAEDCLWGLRQALKPKDHTLAKGLHGTHPPARP